MDANDLANTVDTSGLASLAVTHVYYNPHDPLSLLCAWLAILPQGLCVMYATLCWSTREAEVALAFAGQLACEAANFGLKRLIKEERPLHATHKLLFRKGYGMPSSHAQFAGFWAMTLALFLLVRYKRREEGMGQEGNEAKTQASKERGGWTLLERLGVSALGFTVAVMIAWSRVYLHYHTPRQVLVGYAAGTTVAVGWFLVTGIARHLGLIRWALDLPPARFLRMRDLVVEEDLVQAGWEAWRARVEKREAAATVGVAKKRPSRGKKEIKSN